MLSQPPARRSPLALLVAVLSGTALGLSAGAVVALPATAAVQPVQAPAPTGGEAPSDDEASTSDVAPARDDGAGRDTSRAAADDMEVTPLYAIGGLMLVGAAATAASRRRNG
ncbi:hypothetical protein [Microbacterium sp. JZ31]|uniref:hypothetical protein n=1 Tax=Microbacterium sp. JZ31 TaxID=1906274 RepID=UPI0019332910|nr:hypothetical protein [Microbacterium sp. JZ31]